ncbi:MAG: C1 family peptidase [Pirellulales bacterium]
MSVLYTPVGRHRNDPGEVGVVLTDESQQWIRERLRPMQRRMSGTLPEKIDPGPWMTVEDQGNVSSCRGHSGSSVYEMAFYWATGHHVQFSRQHMYVSAQRESGIRGDQGATIAGGFKVMLETRGMLPESYWPYTGSYVSTPPMGWEKADQISANYHADQLVEIPDFNAAIEFLGRRMGAIDVGFMWSGLMDEQAANTGVIERWAPGSGGHAIFFPGYELIQFRGREVRAIKMFNSWSRRWGKNGTVLWLEEAFNAMLNHRWTEVGGVSGVRLGPQAELPAWKPQW